MREPQNGQPEKAIVSFLMALYGPDAPGWLTISTFDSQPTQWFPAHQLDQVATYCQATARRFNVYFGLGLRQEQLADGRGESPDVLGIPGFWMEIDLRHPVHRKRNLPETIDEVLALVQEALPLKPSVIIFSGYGIHVYWLFRELWLFEDDSERQAAYHLLHRLQATIQGMARLHTWDIDSTFDLARVLRIPGTYNRKIPDEPKLVTILEAHDDRRYNPYDFAEYLIKVDETTYQQTPRETFDGELPPIELHTLKIPTWLNTLIRYAEDVNAAKPYPSRSEALFDAVQGLIKAGVDDQTSMSLLLDSRYAVSEKPREKGRKWLASEIARARAKLNGYHLTATTLPAPEASEPTPDDGHHASPPTTDTPPPIHLTDRGNALRLIKAHGGDLHYLYRWKTWLVWDDGRWVVDEGHRVEARAKAVITQLYGEAKTIIDDLAQTSEEPTDMSEAALKIRAQKIEIATATLKWALKSESAERLAGMLKHARSERGIPITPDDLDADPWLLNCANGTIDLRTETLRPHRREDLCMKRLSIAYDPATTCPHWDAFLWRIMGGPPRDEDGPEELLLARHERAERLVTFLQRAVGYSLTGVIREQVLFFMYGGGDNGKTTFSETIAALMGDYYQKAPKELLMQKDRVSLGGPSPEIARLYRVRLVIASEVGEHHRLNEAQVKDLTGDDTLTARGLYEAFFQFRPTHKLWMYGNHKPSVQGTDDAIWKRPKLIPFTEKIPPREQVADLRETSLIPELAGILAWAVRGCLDWQKDGLHVPDEVNAATAAYRREMDALAAFLDEHCLIGKDYTAKGPDLYARYTQWAESGRETVFARRKFFNQLRERGCESFTARSNVLYWRGGGLKTTESSQSDEDAKRSFG